MTRQQGELGIERLCELARVARAGYYRHWQKAAPPEADVELRDRLQRLCMVSGLPAEVCFANIDPPPLRLPSGACRTAKPKVCA
jgi:hypothetical protein